MSIPIDKVFGSSLYAKGRVQRLNAPGGSVVGITNAGELLGSIYSYVLFNGKVYWMIDSPFGTQTFFVEHNPSLLNLPNKQAILNQIAIEAEKQKIEDKGILQYNIDKYLPWIIGGGIAIIALPSIVGAQNKLAGMKKNKTVLLVGAALLAYFLLYKKRPKAGTPIIESIDEGFVPEYETASTLVPGKPVMIEDYYGNQTAVPSTMVSSGVLQDGQGVKNASGGSGVIEYVGPFKVNYQNPQNNFIAGTGRRGNLGALKTC